jgi:predicted metalloprotease with PDZ domain
MANLKLVSTFFIAAAALAQQPQVKLNVDATDASRRLIHATMQFPVKPGPLSLLYPDWIPGEHGPTGPITDLVGIKVSAAGKSIPWHRDSTNMYEFHVEVPPGASTLDVAIEYILPPEAGGFSAGSSSTTQLAVLSWNQFLLYPAGTPTDQLNYQATLKVPSGWRYGTALSIDRESGNEIVFKPSSLTTLIDSPVQTGANFKTVDLNPGGGVVPGVPHYLHIAADSERATRITDEQIQHYRNLVQEASTLFGAHHFPDYHFLYTLSDHVAHFGLEHHASSDDRTDEDALTDPDANKLASGLLPHEFVHSWNGKFRRPAGLATPDYDKPMKGDLLWVYEGLTNYLGEILTPRTGLSTPQQFLDTLAAEAAALDNQSGREWRPLEDTAVAAQLLYGARSDYQDFRRSTDYYEEGTLIWLDADVTIRTLSNGTKSLDDFAKAWAGSPTTMPQVKPYTFDDVVKTLNSVQPFDWAKFLNDRLQSTAPHAPLNGITNGGYQLVYTKERSDWTKALEGVRKAAGFSYSLGLSVKETGDIIDVAAKGPAFKAKVAPGTKIIAVNGREFSGTVLRHAIEDAEKDTSPITLIVKDGDYYKTYSVDYHEGLKYPHLVRDTAKPDLISDIVKPHAATTASKSMITAPIEILATFEINATLDLNEPLEINATLPSRDCEGAVRTASQHPTAANQII